MTESRPSTTTATLVDALAAEYRLRRAAQTEESSAALWVRRANLAEGRGLLDLAAQARDRARQHLRLVETFNQRTRELRAVIESLQARAPASRGHGRAPPEPSLERRFSKLEIDRELEIMRRSLHDPAEAQVRDSS